MIQIGIQYSPIKKGFVILNKSVINYLPKCTYFTTKKLLLVFTPASKPFLKSCYVQSVIRDVHALALSQLIFRVNPEEIKNKTGSIEASFKDSAGWFGFVLNLLIVLVGVTTKSEYLHANP